MEDRIYNLHFPFAERSRSPKRRRSRSVLPPFYASMLSNSSTCIPGQEIERIGDPVQGDVPLLSVATIEKQIYHLSSLGRSRDRNGDREGKRNKEKKVEEEEEEKTQEQIEEEELMKKMMGFTHFDSTKVNNISRRI